MTDAIAYIVSRFCLGLIVVVPLIATIAPVLLDLLRSKDRYR